MREAKYRAWDGKTMFYDVEKTYEYIDTGNDAMESPLLFDSFGLLIESINDTPGADLMQYTGLKDKNGKEIYEGDIVYVAGVGLCPVEWDGGCACFVFLNREYHDVIEDVEDVRGNIHENPELLGKGES